MHCSKRCIAQIEFMCVLYGLVPVVAAAAMVIQLAQRDASGDLGDDPDDRCPICLQYLRVRVLCVMCGNICHHACGLQNETTGWQFHCVSCLDDDAPIEVIDVSMVSNNVYQVRYRGHDPIDLRVRDDPDDLCPIAPSSCRSLGSSV